MEAYAVSRAVNSVKNDTEEYIEPGRNLMMGKFCRGPGRSRRYRNVSDYGDYDIDGT
jgi:hypothetical protein